MARLHRYSLFVPPLREWFVHRRRLRDWLPRSASTQRRRLLWRGVLFQALRIPRGRPLLLITAVAVITLMVFSIILEQRVAPQVQALVEIAARQQASQAIAEAVERVLTEEGVTYERLAAYEEQNGVKSIQTNAVEINLLRLKINQAVEEAVRSRRSKLSLPLGALLGSQLFSGTGPSINVRLAMTGDAVSDIRSDISGAGVNQTMHRILMDLHVTLAVILPGGAQQTDVALTICLAETVIVGNIPNGIGVITQK